jgi:hypothetical protein
VRHEKQVANNHRLDLYIRDEIDGDEYLIEAKISSNINSPRREVREKVEFYQDCLDDHQHSFILIFAFDDRHYAEANGGSKNDISSFWSGARINIVEKIPNCDIVLRALPEDWKSS